jgi:dienelactone hydrolase
VLSQVYSYGPGWIARGFTSTGSSASGRNSANTSSRGTREKGTIRYLPSASRGTALLVGLILVALSACTGDGGNGGVTIPTSDGSPPELSLGAGVTGGGPNVSVNTGGSDATLELRTKTGNLNLLASGKDPESGIRSLQIWINETTGSCASASPCSTRGPDLSGAPRFDSTDPPKQPGDKTSASSVMAQALNLSSEIPQSAPTGGSFSLRWDIYATSTNYLDGTSQTRTITVTYHDPPLPPSPPSPPPPTPGLAPAPSAPIDTYGVGKISEQFEDRSRPTRSSGSFPGAATRKLPTAIYYPASLPPGTPPGIITPASLNAPPVPPPTTPAGAPTRYPLILFSHGLQASASFFESRLIAKWASAGYVVAAPEYPLTNMATINMFQINLDDAFADVQNQPADAKFVIDEVIKLGQQTTGPLSGIVHSEQIGAAGHSVGGTTTYGLAYTVCCSDPRIKAAVAMSACAGYVGGPAGHFTRDPVPLLILHGDADTTVPYDPFAVEAFTAAKEPKFGFRFVGAPHNSPFTGVAFGTATETQATALRGGTIDHWDRYLKNDTAASQKLNTDFNVAGVTPISPGPPITPSNLTPCVRGTL